MKHINRIRGGMFGAACGDSLNKLLKYLPNKERYKKIYNGVKRYFVEDIGGEVTDDTRMMLATAKGIIESPKEPTNSIGKFFLKIYHDNPENLGLTIRIALAEYERYKDWKKASLKAHLRLGGRSAGNGSLMRTLPIALYYNNLDRMIEITKKQSNLTHYSKTASEACILYNILVYRYIRGENKIDVLKEVLKKFPLYKDILDIDESKLTRRECAVDTLRCSLWCLLNTESYEEAVLKSIEIYEDKDTIGTITGGIAGVYYGYDNISEKWTDSLSIKDELFMISEKISKAG
ncbi:ADP-ribosylglycohydrolase family protein [Clostridium sp. ZS2-4]|uniref:ADP-ribosylglycohydrolase family protein n=1 Tax=Clostridium sp. ZS2-4 TaxID=2987703 RepID=UPI00227B31B8|nr:ADP-ribosylglycohydrolase family protein [Clostridium sp. ZS2-4]MCY6355024.1 ADP-ribosylglycohydrolase family protein [Clostridium sp. ZS2-4]